MLLLRHAEDGHDEQLLFGCVVDSAPSMPGWARRSDGCGGEEVDCVDDEVDDAFIVRAGRQSPLQAASRYVAADLFVDLKDDAGRAASSGWNRWCCR